MRTYTTQPGIPLKMTWEKKCNFPGLSEVNCHFQLKLGKKNPRGNKDQQKKVTNQPPTLCVLSEYTDPSLVRFEELKTKPWLKCLQVSSHHFSSSSLFLAFWQVSSQAGKRLSYSKLNKNIKRVAMMAGKEEKCKNHLNQDRPDWYFLVSILHN